MGSLIAEINKRLTIQRILVSFWGMFWLLNGMDKFFNKGSFFGVTRDEKFIAYFKSINLSADLALFSLYSCGILEVFLGIGFLFCLIKKTHVKVLLTLNFKLSMLIFLTFSAFDILFGDRPELWEHGTFFGIALISALTINTEKTMNFKAIR